MVHCPLYRATFFDALSFEKHSRTRSLNGLHFGCTEKSYVKNRKPSSERRPFYAISGREKALPLQVPIFRHFWQLGHLDTLVTVRPSGRSRSLEGKGSQDDILWSLCYMVGRSRNSGTSTRTHATEHTENRKIHKTHIKTTQTTAEDTRDGSGSRKSIPG